MKPEERAEYLKPFTLTSILKEEMMNLREENEGVNIILKQAYRGIRKDKFSAFEYGLYYIKQEEDKKKKDSIDAKNHLENTIYQAEKMPTEYKDKISDEDKETIKKAVEEAKKILNNDKSDKDQFETATKELNDRIMPIGAKLYQATTEDKESDGKAKDSSSDEAVEGEVVDK